MPIAYQKDIKLYITIEALERIKHLFKNVKGIKSRLHKLFMSDQGNNLLFDANEYTLIKVGEEKHNEKEKEKEKKKDRENDADNKINEAKEIDKEEQKDKKKENEKEKEKEKKEKERKKDTQENKKKDIEKDKQKEKNKDKQKGKSKQKGGVSEKKTSSVEQETEEGEIKEHGNETTLLQPSDVTVEEEANVKTEEVEDERTTEEKRKKHETIFNDKCIEDEYDLVSEEMFKSFFPDENIKFGKKYKILIEVIMQTIIYADKIKLNIYKLNLFISIIIMTLHQIMKNLGKKKRKKRVIKYFMELLDKNTDYGTSKNEPTHEHLDTENSTTIPTESVQQLPQMNGQESKSELKSTLQKETVEAAEDSKESDTMEKEKTGKADVNKLELEQEQNQEEMEFILFDYREAKYIIKYMFENIFSIYNIYEYMFLFSPVPINLTLTNSSSFVTPTESFTLDDKLEFDGTIPDNDKNATNSYIKEMLDVPMFVLDKFYDHIEDLREKIDDFVKRP